MSSASACHYLTVDAFPLVEGPHFQRVVGAVIGCWVPTRVRSPEVLIESKLHAAGWACGRIMAQEIVTRETYAWKADGRTEFEHALADGFAAHAHLRARETIVRDGAPDAAPPDVDAFVRLIDHLRAGACSLSSVADAQWANGVSPDGDEFLPLWAGKEAASAWHDLWPGFELHEVPADELTEEGGLLQSVAHEGMWIGLGTLNSLVMTHPLLLRQELRKLRA